MSEEVDLSGAIDLHVHTAPDAAPRSLDDHGLRDALAARGFAGAVLKGHREPTGGRAIAASGGGVTLYGAVVLNYNVGGLNPAAVEAFRAVGGDTARMVWLPTLDAANDLEHQGRPGEGLRVMRAGVLAPGLGAVLEVVAAHDLVLASGHVSPAETCAVFRVARAAGCRRLLATHVAASLTDFDDAQMAEVVALGGHLEFTALSVLKHPDGTAERRHAVERIARAVQAHGADRVVLSSDAGKSGLPSAPDCLLTLTGLLTGWLTATTVEHLAARTPRDILL